MIKIQILLFSIYQLSTCSRLLLQQTLRGAYGQTCMIPAPDVICPNANTILTDQASGTIECGVEFDCCLCQSITCGSQIKACDTFKAGAEYAIYGVQRIVIYGEVNGPGATVDCNAFASCSSVYMIGSWINMIQCGAEKACNLATMNFANSYGLICSVNACHGARFLLNSNRGGTLSCISQGACTDAIIEINNIQDVKCNGPHACSNAKITVTDPVDGFNLDCNGDLACENLELTIIISKPINTCLRGVYDIISWKAISCTSNSACEGLKYTIENNGCKSINIEDLQCTPDRSCFGAIFHLNAGTGPETTLQNCLCGPSCSQATGIDACYNNLQAIECIGTRSCANQIRLIQNPSNDFVLLCADIESCFGLQLTLSITGVSQNMIRRIAGIYCQDVKSCANAVIEIQNAQMMRDSTYVSLNINSILCNSIDACSGTTFIIGPYNNVIIDNIMCIDGACNNCMVKETKTSVGTPCQYFKPINGIPNRQNPIITTTTSTTPIPTNPIPTNPIPTNPIIHLTTKNPITTQQTNPIIYIPTQKPPIYITQKPIVTTQKPIVTTQKPIVTTQKPIVTTQKPIVTTQKPFVTTQKSFVTTQKPFVTTQKPIAITTTPPVITTTITPKNPVIPIPDIPTIPQLPAIKSTTSKPNNPVISVTTPKPIIVTVNVPKEVPPGFQ